MESSLPLRKGCNCYSTAHCYLVEPKDFEVAPAFFVGNQVGGALNFVVLNPNEIGSLVERITGGTLKIDLPNGNSYEFEGVENSSGGLNFTIDPVVAIEEENKGKWQFSWQPTFKTISDLECNGKMFQTEIEIGNEVPENTEE